MTPPASTPHQAANPSLEPTPLDRSAASSTAAEALLNPNFRLSPRPATSTPRHRLPFALSMALLTAALIAAILLSLALGAVHVAPGTLLHALAGVRPLSETDRLILFEIRLPRILAAGLVGAALACAGLLFQGLFRNPMADPYVLGASGGSVLGAACGIFLLPAQSAILGFSGAAGFAFLGALVTMLAVYGIARRNGRTNTVTLLLAGFALSTVLTNSTYIFELLDSASGSGTRVLASWLHGVISTPRWSELDLAAALLAVSLVLALPLAHRLNTLALGEEHAAQLGLAVEPTRLAVVALGSLLTATAVALGGPISFAGLIVPHVARLLFGADTRRLLPITALGGATFVILADTLARTVLAPTEIPVGILMAALGAPFFLYLLRRSRRSYTL